MDIARRVASIHGDQAKTGKPIHVTLNATAIEVLTKQIGKDPKAVFTYKGMPVIQVNTKAWYKALGRAGIENFRWHDLHAYLCELVDSTRRTAERNSGNGRVGIFRDGEAVCTPGTGAVCEAHSGSGQCAQWHKFGITRMKKGLAITLTL